MTLRPAGDLDLNGRRAESLLEVEAGKVPPELVNYGSGETSWEEVVDNRLPKEIGGRYIKERNSDKRLVSP